jgi:hypothetical protein
VPGLVVFEGALRVGVLPPPSNGGLQLIDGHRASGVHERLLGSRERLRRRVSRVREQRDGRRRHVPRRQRLTIAGICSSARAVRTCDAATV